MLIDRSGTVITVAPATATNDELRPQSAIGREYVTATLLNAEVTVR
jgi:hypothetical protein